MHPGRRFSQLLPVALLALSSVNAFAQGRSADHGFFGLMPLLHREHVASVSFATIANGRTMLAEAYGEAAPGVSASNTTLYNIASLSKPISAEVILRLASAGKLSLDEPMWRYWIDPDLAADQRAELLTPRMALDHQTGFANWRRASGSRLAFIRDPGTAFGYSGEGYQYVKVRGERRRASRSRSWPKHSSSIRQA